MGKFSSGGQDDLETRLRQFLTDHPTQWFSVMQLAQEEAVSGDPADIQRTLAAMGRLGMVTSQKKGFGEPWTYKAVLTENDKPGEK
jgi:hypothetical protein